MKRPNIDMKSKSAKYFVAQRLKGMSKSEAVKVAGISDIRNVNKFEETVTYKALEEKYKDHMLKHLGMDDVAAEHTKIILQDVNLNAKTAAIKLFLERVEPETIDPPSEDTMLVVMRR